MAQVETVLIDSASHQRNSARIAADEAELEKLKKLARGEIDEEETTDSESDSESVENAEVQDESVPEQETKADTPETEAQEEDAGLSAEEKSFKKRYSDIRRHMQDKDKEHKAALEKLQKQLEAATNNELVLPKSQDEVEAWAKKYPDVAGIVEAIAEKKANERASDLDSRLAEIEEMRISARKEKAEVELLSMHPDFATIREDDAFHNWAEEQPKWVQDALYENVDDAKSVSRVLDLYKVDKGIAKSKSNGAAKDAASSVKAKKAAPIDPDDSSRYLRESDVAKMSIKEYEKRADEIMEAQRSGKFIYDMSKRQLTILQRQIKLQHIHNLKCVCFNLSQNRRGIAKSDFVTVRPLQSQERFNKHQPHKEPPNRRGLI